MPIQSLDHYWNAGDSVGDACAQFGDLQLQITYLGGQGAGPVAIAVAEPLVGALLAVRTEEGSKLQLDQPLKAVARQLEDQLPGAAAIE